MDFLGLARIARDILSTPATGVGTERVFNSSRDICYFQQARLLPKTICTLTILNYFNDFHPIAKQEAALEDLTQLAKLTNKQLKVEEEERLAELKQA